MQSREKKNPQNPSYDTLLMLSICSRYVNLYPIAHPFLYPRHDSSWSILENLPARINQCLAITLERLVGISQVVNYRSVANLMPFRCRCSVPQHEPDQALLAELCRLPQVHPGQGRGLCSLPSGTSAAPSPKHMRWLSHFQTSPYTDPNCSSGWPTGLCAPAAG